MRDSSIVARVRLAPVALIPFHFAFAILVVVSIFELYQTVLDIFRAIGNVNGVLLAAALAAALVPAGCVIFWGCNAIAMQLERPFRWVRQYFE
jgi:hypothetical protein